MGLDVNFEYIVNGRKVSREEWENHLFQRAKAAGINVAKQRILSLRCPVHGQAPQVRDIDGTDKMDVAACCDVLMAEVRRLFNS